MNTPSGDNPLVSSPPNAEEQVQFTPRQIQTIYHITYALTASSNLPTLLQSIVNSAAEVLPANCVTLLTFDMEARQVIHFVKGGPGVDHVVATSFDDLWVELSGWSLRERKPALSHDLYEETNGASTVVVPLQVQDGLLGLMTVTNRPDEPKFTHADVTFLIAIANLSAIAIENSRLSQTINAEVEDRVEKRTTELIQANVRLQQVATEHSQAENTLHERERHSQSLLRLSRNLENVQTCDDVLNAAQNEVKQAIGYQNLWVYLMTEDRKCFKALMAGGQIADAVMSEDGTATLLVQGDPMLQEIIETQSIVVVENARTDPRTNKEIVAQLDIHTLINVPIILFDQLLGVVGTGTFGDDGVRVPTPAEREYFTVMASHMAVALHRIHLLDERKQADEERAAHLRFFEGLDRVNRTMQGTTDLDQMMRDVLDVLLSIFDCDRAWLVYPCDPDAATWQVPMERTRPEYPGVLPVGVELPLDPVGAAVYRILRDSAEPVQFNAAAEHQVPIEMVQGFNVQSFIAMAFYPKIGKAWAFGLHQCSSPRVWTPEEERLFRTIGNRLSDALTSLLAYRDLAERERHSQSLLRLSKGLEQAQTYSDMLNVARNEVRTIIGYQNLWVYLLSEDKEYARVLVSGGYITSAMMADENVVTLHMRGDPMLEEIVEGKGIVVVEDARIDPRTNKEIVAQLGNRTIVNVPIILFDQLMGSVGTGTFGDEGVRAPSPSEQEYLTTMASHLAVALQRIHLLIQRKQAEEALSESEARYRSIVASMGEGIVLQDRNGDILTYNAAAESLLGLTGNQLLGQDSIDLDRLTIREDGSHFPGETHPAMITLQTGIPQRNVIMGIRKAEGDLTWISINSEPLMHPDEPLPYAVVTSFTDITEHKRVQSVMQARLRLLEFAGSHSMDELLTATLDEIEGLTGSTIGFYHFLEADQKTLALQNWSTNTLKSLCTAEGKGSHYDVDQAGVWVDCIHERRPVIHNDYASLPHCKGIPEGHAPVIREAVVPIFRGNLIEAIIGVGNKATPYNEHDIEIIAQLGDLSWDIAKRKQAEEALQKQYSTLHGIMENANALIFSIDREYRYTSFNQAHANVMKMLYGGEIEIGQSLLQYMSVIEDREVAKHNLDRALAGERLIEESYSGEELRSRRYFQVFHSPVQTETGEIMGVVVLAQDVTERKEMAQKLEESEKRLRLTLEATRIGVWDWNIEKEESYASPVYYTMFGYEPKVDSIKQNEWLERIHPDDLDYVKDKIQSVLSQDFKEYEYEARTRHADGTYRWQYVKGLGVERDADEKVTRMLGIRMDITERKHSEAALKESELRYRQIFDNTSDSLYLLEVTADGRFRNLEVNPALEISTGISRDQLIGKTQEETVPQEIAQLVNAKYRRCVEVGEPIEEELDLDLPSGHHSYQSTLIPVRDDTGNIYRIIGVSRDVTERNQAAEALRQSEQQFRLLAENSTDMITRHAPDGTYLYASPACSTLLGYEPKDLIGHSSYEFIHPIDIAAVEQSHTTILNEPMVYTVQYRIRHKDGQYSWFETTSKTVFDDQTNTITEIQAASRDITERKQMEQTLAMQERESRTLLENIPDLIVRYDTNLQRIYVNPAWEKASGLMIREVVNKPPVELQVPKPIVTEYLEKLQNVLETGVRETIEFTWVNVRGEELTLNYIIVPEYDPDGKMVSILCVGHDITERKQAEVILRHYSQRLSILHEIDQHILKAQSPQDIASTVLERLIHLIPCEWACILLYDDTTTQAEIFALHQPPDAHFHVEKKYAVISNQVLEQLKLGHSITIPDLQTAQGPHTELSKQLRAENLRAKLMTPLITQNQLIGVLVLASRQVAHFTLERQQVAEEVGAQLAIAFHQANLNDQIARHTVELERRVRERTTELEHVNRELEAFSYSVSHDLRAPLRAIEGFAEIIARRHRETLNDEGRRYFDNIVQASEQMNQLITDLLTYARLGRQKQGLLKLIPLDPILAEVLDNLAPLIVEKGGQVQVASDLPYVRGDKTLLKQIFANLIENALVYHRPDVLPVVSVTYTAEDNAFVIVVEDNGIGIPPEFREKIFGIFQRLHNQDQYPGTGIGLAIVRKTVEMLGGTVWVESADVHGSRFFIKFLTDAEKDG